MDFDTLIKILRDELIAFLIENNMDKNDFETISLEKIDNYIKGDCFEDAMMEAFDVFFLISR